MKSTPIFSGLSKALVRRTMNIVKPITHHKGRVVIKENEPNQHLYIVKSGVVEITKRIKKPFSDQDSSKKILRQEKYNLKDKIYGIVRNTDEMYDEQNHVIEGDDTGMMGAHESFPQVPKTAQ